MDLIDVFSILIIILFFVVSLFLLKKRAKLTLLEACYLSFSIAIFSEVLFLYIIAGKGDILLGSTLVIYFIITLASSVIGYKNKNILLANIKGFVLFLFLVAILIFIIP